MFPITRRATAALVGSFALATLAGAHPRKTVVSFDNDPTSRYSGGSNRIAQGHYVAQDFILALNSTLNRFTFNAHTTKLTAPVSAVNLNIYASASGAPGALRFGGTFSVAS